MKEKLLLLFLLLSSLSINAKKDLRAFALYNNNGKAITFDAMIEEASKYKVVFIGEMHNCPVTHWLELKITEALYAKHKDSLLLGAEMFEADNQLIFNEYLKGVISYDQFNNEMRLWPNYETDYEPLVMFAKEYKRPFIATNVPRRYANVVKNRGLDYLDSLTEEAKRLLPPLPIIFTMEGKNNEAFSVMSALHGGNDNPKQMQMAQALKDATMAWNIAKNIGNNYMVHYNGSYHTSNHDGIITYLKEYKPSLKSFVIMAVKQEDISKIDDAYKNLADCYIVIPQDMSRSY